MRRFSLKNLLILTAIIAVSLSLPPWLHYVQLQSYDVSWIQSGDPDYKVRNAQARAEMERQFTPLICLICVVSLCGVWYAWVNRKKRFEYWIGVSFAIPLSLAIWPPVAAIPVLMANVPGLALYQAIGLTFDPTDFRLSRQLLALPGYVPTALAYAVWPAACGRNNHANLLFVYSLFCNWFAATYFFMLFATFGD